MGGRAKLGELQSCAMTPADAHRRKRNLARHFRRNPSMAERALWKLLRGKKLEGLRFRGQMPIGPYVVDFVCLRHRLVVEVDGPVHDLRPDDPARDEWLRTQNFRVMRFSSADVFSRSEEVLERIAAAVRVPL